MAYGQQVGTRSGEIKGVLIEEKTSGPVVGQTLSLWGYEPEGFVNKGEPQETDFPTLRDESVRIPNPGALKPCPDHPRHRDTPPPYRVERS